ncbi:DUF6228 family protein [Geomonas propionica]|uniref:Uncharacterized protein n=1 Tax=Geomonas propionica TaxID=2798582 RepID=A0ABS0YVS4_9BACT|nr:DUF6228 family protein [Geomonas propionica]MBJ6802075.1 hypothetical protein [Geomonas propionica]
MFQIKSTETDGLPEFFDFEGDSFKVSVRSKSHSALREVYGYPDAEGIAQIFREAANQWRGWSGTKMWESLEGEFKIELKADKTGHVTIYININHDGGNTEPWRLKSCLLIEAGQLEAIAKRATEFFKA